MSALACLRGFAIALTPKSGKGTISVNSGSGRRQRSGTRLYDDIQCVFHLVAEFMLGFVHEREVNPILLQS